MACLINTPSSGWHNLNLTSLYEAQSLYNQTLVNISNLISKRLEANPSPTNDFTAFAVQTAGYHLSKTVLYHSNATGPTLPSGPTVPAHPVSWQSAFWGLAALAINTCLQDCGKVCEINKELAVLIRSSPLFCLVDTLITIYQLLYYTVKKGPSRAAKIVAYSRQQQDVQRIGEDRPRAVYQITRALLILVAALQSVKLFALRGIAWTQVFGACYLASYMFNAILNIFGKSSPEDQLNVDNLPRRGDVVPSVLFVRWSSILLSLCQLGLWTILMKPAIPEKILESTDFCLLVLHVPILAIYIIILWAVCLVGFLLLFTPGALIDITITFAPAVAVFGLLELRLRQACPSMNGILASLLDVRKETASWLSGSLLVAVSILLRICLWPWFLTAKTGEVFLGDRINHVIHAFEKGGHSVSSYSFVISVIAAAALLSYAFARVVFFGIIARKLHLCELSIASNLGWASLFLFSTNVACALLYYTLVYTPRNTYKPPWTENLGKFLL